MMLNNNPYSEVKGFNYWPSYAMVLNDVMDRFDLEIVKRELKGAQNLGASCVRVWVSNVSWQRSAPRFLSDFRALLSAAESYGILVMPVLFNRWVDTDYPVGELDLTTVMMPLSGANREYLRSFLGEFRNDSRILMWDLCNEPFYTRFCRWKRTQSRRSRDWKSATGRNALLRSAGFLPASRSLWALQARQTRRWRSFTAAWM